MPETDFISLYQWAKDNDVAYSRSQKFFNDGELDGAYRSGKRVFVPRNLPVPEKPRVQCAACGKRLEQITISHIKMCSGIQTLEEYAERFPDAERLSDHVRSEISRNRKGILMTPEQRKRISDAKKGKRPNNHPRYVRGVHKASEETRRKMSEAHTGRKHSEETKAKISSANKGQLVTEEQKAKRAITMKERFPNGQPAAFKGRHHSEESKRLLSEAQKRHQASLSEEERQRRALIRAEKTRGKKRTKEMKEKYRQATLRNRVKYKTKFRNTKGELFIKQWLTDIGLPFIFQYRHEGIDAVFDFFLPDYDLIIEFDGAHHWHSIYWGTHRPKEVLEEELQRFISRDAETNWKVGQAGLKIIRVFGKAIPGDSYHGTLEEQLIAQGFDEITGVTIFLDDEEYVPDETLEPA